MKINRWKLEVAMANVCMGTADLAASSGVSRGLIAGYLSGSREPTPKTAGRIAKALNVPAEDLVDKEGWKEDGTVMEREGIRIGGHQGTWYVVGETCHNGGKVYLLEHETWSDGAARLIVNENLEVVLDDVRNGFGDLEEMPERAVNGRGRKKKTELDKGRFLKTELGSDLKECVRAWDKWLGIKDEKAAYWCQAQWEVYKLALKHFYGVGYSFTRTDEYFGICTEDESDWLFKVERQVKEYVKD